MKCEFCSSEAKANVMRMPVCLSCMLAISLELNKTIEAVKESNWIEDDKREVEEIEKRYCRKGED